MRIVVLLAALSPAALLAQDMPFTVQLTTGISTSASHPGDPVAGKVLEPAAFSGDTIQGHVTEAKSGNKLHGSASLRFNFDTIQHNGAAVPISSTITSITNSKGQQNVDEEGTVVNHTSNIGKAALGTGAGALIGGLTGGGKGAAIGAGIGAAASIAAIEVAAKGPKVEFAPGSKVGLSVKSRGGPDLASLPPNVGNTAVASAAAPAPVANSAAPGAPLPAVPTSGASGGQPQLSSIKIDFIPGERTIFYDDFSDMAQDEPPPHWKLRGHPVELRIGQGIRELYAAESCELTSPSFQAPANFTFEMIMTGQGETRWDLRNKNDDDLLDFIARGEPSGQDFNTHVSWAGHGTLGEGGIQADNSQPMQFALWVQQGRLRVYLNGTRVVDVNQVEVNGFDHIVLHDAGYRPVGLRRVRVAESAPDFSQTISSTGRYVTHGIYFDTDSDRLKPESAAVIKMVAQGLQKNPNLKLEIDGYTDSTGDAQHNLDLSKRRAEAVRSVLVSQFGIDAARLASAGFGADKPIGSNDTPDGRAQNRRVEFVKQ
jgi:OOP family OmpA-OmpF porin